MRIGILTGGGDCPGLNAVIRAVVRTCDSRYGSSVVGFQDGWRGLLENRRMQLANDDRNDRLLAKGGTMLGTARVHPDKLRAGLDQIKQTLDDNGIDVLIPIGGEGTLTAAHWLSEENVPVVGVPKTIDNDIDCTDVTFGHDTALTVATDAIDRLHSTAESHQRVMLVEVMGRHAGWIALNAGLASGAHMTLIPEQPFDVEEVCRLVKRRFQRGDSHFICVVAEGAKPVRRLDSRCAKAGLTSSAMSGSPASPPNWALEVEKRINKEVRVTVLGHVQRGGTPDGLRPGAGHPVRGQRRRRRARRRVRPDGVAARTGHRPGAAGRRRAPTQAGARKPLRRRRGFLRLSRRLAAHRSASTFVAINRSPRSRRIAQVLWSRRNPGYTVGMSNRGRYRGSFRQPAPPAQARGRSGDQIRRAESRQSDTATVPRPCRRQHRRGLRHGPRSAPITAPSGTPRRPAATGSTRADPGGTALDGLEQLARRDHARSSWRDLIHRLTGIDLGPSKNAACEHALRDRIRTAVGGAFPIAVLNLKGGVGKTAVVEALGSTFADVRDDRVIAVDIDAGDLAERHGRRNTR